MVAAIVPASLRQLMATWRRPNARFSRSCSGSIFARITQKAPDQLQKTGRDPQKQKHQIKIMSAELLVEKVSDDIADACGCRQQKSQRGVLSNQNRSEEHTSELQSRLHLVCRLLLEKKKKKTRKK